MNKLYMLALVGLVFSGVNNASMMGQEQREVLYTLNTLGQDFVNVPMITQNIDMFMGVLEMNIQVNEAQLKVANQKMKKSFLAGAVLCGGLLVAQNFSAVGLNWLREHYLLDSENMFDVVSKLRLVVIDGFVVNDLLGVVTIGKVVAGLNIYDAWKNRSELMEAIALDKEILAKLEEIKDSMSFLEENADSEGNILLNSAE